MTKLVSHGLVLFAALALASPAYAAEPEKTPPPSKETRQKMADVHQKMAECLRSDRPMSECRAEMTKSCHDMVGESGCPMMGRGKGGMGPGTMEHGHGKGPGMEGPPPPAPPPKQ